MMRSQSSLFVSRKAKLYIPMALFHIKSNFMEPAGWGYLTACGSTFPSII